ncbi:cyclic nucleotide-binding domain-containing protein [Rhodospirillum sp. A1_3_36]|uniref:cyclic nucleotide-binding domain-containing protein n=1 Tax=Rhodospirillum sp. A1_3_36 TaxID=3391666 RepID=UPI0039A4AD5C
MTLSDSNSNAGLASDPLGAVDQGDALTSLGLPVKPETMAALRRVAVRRTIPAGTVILTEGDRTNAFFLIKEGVISVYRLTEHGDADGSADNGERVLTDLGPGEALGEMAVLDGLPRSASARAKTEVVLEEVQPNDLLSEPDGDHLLADLRGGLGVAIVRKMRGQTDKHVAVLEREVQSIRERQQFGRFFLYAMGMMCIGTLVNDVLARHVLHVNVYTSQFAWQYLALLLLPSLIVMWRMGIPRREIGLTTVGLRRSLVEGAVISLVVLLLTFGLAEVLKAFDALPGKPVPFEWAGSLSYFIHSLLQELVARGFLQSSFQRFLGDRKGFGSIVLASLFFGMFHLHFGFTAVFLTIVTGLLFGLIYQRHRNLAGVTLVHYMSGAAAFWVGLI